MSQTLYINLDGGELPLQLLPAAMKLHGEDPIVRCQSDAVELALLEKGTIGGNHTVGIFTPLPDGKLAMIELTGKNFLNAAAAVRDINLGLMNTKHNPGIAIAADPVNKLVHFAAESPIEVWDYSVAEAKRFWRTLREIAEAAS